MKKIIIDKEQDLDKEDYLNTKEYASTLQSLIESSDKEIPLTIGLFGEWGSGKSSIINTVKKKLEAKKDYTTKFIIYDAWKYSNDSFRRMFLKKVQEDLSLEKTPMMTSFYANNSEEIQVNREPNYHFWLFAILAFIIALLLGFKIGFSNDWAFTLTILISIIGVALTNYSKFFNEFKVSVQKPLLFAPEQFEEGFKEILSKGLKKKNLIDKVDAFIKGEGTKNYERIVIVIDNIDRCHKDVAYELLTNTKNFIENGFNVIFLIPVDDEALKRHIFKSDGGNIKESEEFLRKYFNLTLRIKPYKLTEIYDYSLKLNKKYELDFSPDTINIIAKEYASNPRRILQFFNNLQLEVDLIKHKYGADFVQQNEKLICKFLVIREEWPDYFSVLSNSPSRFFDDKNGIDYPDNHKDLIKFLRDTKVITNNIDYLTLEKILVNSDKFGLIPETILNSIDNNNIEQLKLDIGNLNQKVADILDSQITSLESAINQKLYETEIPIILNRIAYLFNNFNGLDIYLDNKLETYLQRIPDLADVFYNSISIDDLVQYSVDIVSRGKIYLNEVLIKLIDDYKNEEELNSFIGKLYNHYIQICRIEDLEKVKHLYELYYRFKSNIIDDPKLNSDRLKILCDKDFIENNLYEPDTFLEDEQNVANWNYLCESLDEQTELLNGVINYAYLRVTTETITSNTGYAVAKKLFPIFKKSSNSELSTSLALDNLNDLLFYNIITRPAYSSSTTDYFELLDLDNSEIIFSYFLECERLSNGTAKISDRFLGFYENFQEVAENVIIEYVEKHNKTSFLGLKAIIMSFSEATTIQLQIFKNVVFKKYNNDFIYNDDDLRKIINLIINKYIGSNELENILSDYIKDERSLPIVKQIFSDLTVSQIEQLPNSLKQLTLDKLTDPSFLTEIVDNFDLLKFIAINGEREHQEKLLPTLKVKINTLNAEAIKFSLEIISLLNNISEQESIDLFNQLKQKSVANSVEDKVLFESIKEKLKINKS